MKFLFVTGIIFFLGSIALFFSQYDTLDVERKGKIVKMRIEELPRSCIGAKVRYFVKYSYNGKVYEKATRGDFCQRHYVGELIDMKFLKGSDVILRPGESVMLNLLSLVFLGLFGASVSISQWKKLKKSR
ncbi:MAG: hypothetical protein K2X37_00120 [Chitinophagaceae bacterium]|nr:hypothetical protein [Chitinophagaceae bacterium]